MENPTTECWDECSMGTISFSRHSEPVARKAQLFCHRDRVFGRRFPSSLFAHLVSTGQVIQTFRLCLFILQEFDSLSLLSCLPIGWSYLCVIVIYCVWSLKLEEVCDARHQAKARHTACNFNVADFQHEDSGVQDDLTFVVRQRIILSLYPRFVCFPFVFGCPTQQPSSKLPIR